MTLTTQLVLRSLLQEPPTSKYGIQVCEETGLPRGTAYLILARLEDHGWLQSEWEDIDPHTEGRPRRRYYTFTPDGIERAREALSRSRIDVRLKTNPIHEGLHP